MNKSLKKQLGFTLIEMSIVVLIMTLLIAAELIRKKDELRFSRASAQGTQLKMFNDAVASYASTHRAAILAGTAIPYAACPGCNPAVAVAGNVAVNLQPTWTELQALGFLPRGTTVSTMYGATVPGYGRSLTPQPLACVGAACTSIESMVWMIDRVTTAGQANPLNADGVAISEIQRTAGGNSGACMTTGAPPPAICPTISFVDGVLGTRPNPVAGTPSGIVAMLSSTLGGGGGGAFDDTHLLPRNGSRAMLGNLNGGGFSLTNAANVTATGAISSATSTTTGNATVGGDLNVTSDIVATGTIAANNVSVTGQTGSLGTAITEATIVTPGSNITKPTCSGGRVAQVFLTPAIYSNTNTGGSIQAVQTWATNASLTQWQVHMRILVQPSLDTNAVTTPANDGWVQDGDFTKAGINYGLLSVLSKCS